MQVATPARGARMKILSLSLLALTITTTAAASELPAEVSSASEAIARFDARAEVRLLSVWATWCAPCVAEMPVLERLQNDLHGLGLAIVGMSMDDAIPGDRVATKQRVARFLKAARVSFTNVYYVGKPNDLADELDFEGEIPVTILFDREGRELWRFEGAFDEKELERTILAHLGVKE